MLGDRIKLGRTRFTVVGLTEHQVASGGDPAVYITLLDAQKLQFDLAPPAARVQLARGATADEPRHRQCRRRAAAPNASPDSVAEIVRRWKHLAAHHAEASRRRS